MLINMILDNLGVRKLLMAVHEIKVSIKMNISKECNVVFLKMAGVLQRLYRTQSFVHCSTSRILWPCVSENAIQ